MGVVKAKKKKSSVVVNLRMKQEQRALIDRAAEVTGKNRSEFLLEAATKSAQDTLLDQTMFHTTPEQWKAFVKALEASPTVIPSLKKLLSSKSPWDK
jgi:uncharacterized protein (DUF1778 family)